MSDEMTRLDEIAARLEATDNGYGAFSALRPEFDALLDAVTAVRALHPRRAVTCLNPLHGDDCGGQICGTCGDAWPCRTIGAVDAALTTAENR